MTAAVGLLSAIIQAKRTGKGCDVDTCLLDVALHQLGYVATWYLNEGHVSTRQPRSAHYSVAPVQTFPTSDGWLFIMCNKEKFWPLLTNAIGKPEWAGDPDFCNYKVRLANRERLTRELDAVLGTATGLRAVHAFHHAWIFMAACSLTAGLILQGIPRKARVRQERVVTCAAEPPAYVLAAGK